MTGALYVLVDQNGNVDGTTLLSTFQDTAVVSFVDQASPTFVWLQ